MAPHRPPATPGQCGACEAGLLPWCPRHPPWHPRPGTAAPAARGAASAAEGRPRSTRRTPPGTSQPGPAPRPFLPSRSAPTPLLPRSCPAATAGARPGPARSALPTRLRGAGPPWLPQPRLRAGGNARPGSALTGCSRAVPARCRCAEQRSSVVRHSVQKR